MTGTAQTEAAELHSIYQLGVVPIRTNRPMVRKDQADLVYRTEEAKFRAVVDDITSRVAGLLHAAGMRGEDQRAGCAACGACSILKTAGA